VIIHFLFLNLKILVAATKDWWNGKLYQLSYGQIPGWIRTSGNVRSLRPRQQQSVGRN
jgi:hypothetical protein